jgi:hypothetical protein
VVAIDDMELKCGKVINLEKAEAALQVSLGCRPILSI